MMQRLVLPALAAAILSACGATVTQQRESLDQARICCRTLAELPFVPLTPGKPESIRLDATRPAFDFDGAKSFFFAARLPPYAGPLVLVIESYATVVPMHPEMTSVFRPDVMFLDASFQVTRRIPPDTIRRSRGADLRATLFINPEDAADAYLVVFTDPRGAAEAGTVKAFTAHTFSLGGAPITLDGSEHTVPLSFSATGRLTVDLQRYEAAPIAR